MSSQPFTIDVDTRTITIPPEFTNAGVQSDHNALTIYFEIGRTYNGEDLSTHSIAIPYINAKGEKDIYGVTNIDLNTPDKIIFSWELSNHVTKYAGTVSFAVRFYSAVDNKYTYTYGTQTASFAVLDGITVGLGEITVKPDILTLIPDVPDWALEANKPAYTAAEVGALPDTADANFVHKSGVETIGGVKTFTDNVVAPNLTLEIKTQSMSNSLIYPFNNSSTSISLQYVRANIDYTVQYEAMSITGGFLGEIIISDKTINGFRVSYTGSATSVTLKMYIKGGF